MKGMKDDSRLITIQKIKNFGNGQIRLVLETESDYSNPAPATRYPIHFAHLYDYISRHVLMVQYTGR